MCESPLLLTLDNYNYLEKLDIHDNHSVDNVHVMFEVFIFIKVVDHAWA